MNDRRTYLKVKLKSLAAEAKIIRQEEQKAKKHQNQELLSGLEWHRKDTVRSAARHTLLAYAFIRGVPYKKVEAKCEKAPDLKRIMAMVQKYGPHYDRIAHFNPDKDASTWHSSTKKIYEEEKARLWEWAGAALPVAEKSNPTKSSEEKRGLVSRIFG